jgi:hypothetical protein
LGEAYRTVLEDKGPGIFTSSHEVLGVITEEYHELVEAITHKCRSSTVHLEGMEPVACNHRPTAAIDGELVDIAVACIHALVSRASGRMEW